VVLDVARASGTPITRVEVMHLNPLCSFPDLSNLFIRDDVTAAAEALVSPIRAATALLRDLNSATERPDVALGAQCERPTPCEFLDRCRGPLPPHPVSELAGMPREKIAALVASGVTVIPELPSSAILPSTAARQRRSVIAGRLIAEKSLSRM